MSDSNPDPPNSPTLEKGVAPPPRSGDDPPPHCYWNGKQYNEGDCVVQNGFWAYSCANGHWAYQGPASACPDYKEDTK